MTHIELLAIFVHQSPHVRPLYATKASARQIRSRGGRGGSPVSRNEFRTRHQHGLHDTERSHDHVRVLAQDLPHRDIDIEIILDAYLSVARLDRQPYFWVRSNEFRDQWGDQQLGDNGRYHHAYES